MMILHEDTIFHLESTMIWDLFLFLMCRPNTYFALDQDTLSIEAFDTISHSSQSIRYYSIRVK